MESGQDGKAAKHAWCAAGSTDDTYKIKINESAQLFVAAEFNAKLRYEEY